MTVDAINGVRLFWEQHGTAGPPLVFVHGSWGDHHNWDMVAPRLSSQFRVFTYDRRGHSRSERLPAQGSIQEDVDDLAALIEVKHLAPAHVVGNSFGGAITLKLAASRPELLASFAVHEPPLLDMIADNPMLPFVRERIAKVIAILQSGDAEGGAREFVENVALGPGMWEQLPAEMRETLAFNASTFVDEINEPERAMTVDLAALAAFRGPALVTRGDQSPPFFDAILEQIGRALPNARRHTFQGAGHVPQTTHPDEYVRVVTDFLQQAAASAAG